jgi:hypothetical protein
MDATLTQLSAGILSSGQMKAFGGVPQAALHNFV